MARSPRKSKKKVINPTFFVFCEGESEVAYISYLRSRFRLPIRIKEKIEKCNIDKNIINRVLRHEITHSKDEIFLMYDIDVDDMLKNLQDISDTQLLASNPCFELWYLFHFHNHNSEINSKDCLNKLLNSCKNYKKGLISRNLKEKLDENLDKAIKNSKKKVLYENPSTSIYVLIEKLNAIKNNK